MLTNITPKKVPQAVYRVMKQETKQQGRNLNARIIGVLESATAELERRRRMPGLRKESRRFAESLLPVEVGALVIRQDRGRMRIALRFFMSELHCVQCLKERGLT